MCTNSLVLVRKNAFGKSRNLGVFKLRKVVNCSGKESDTNTVCLKHLSRDGSRRDNFGESLETLSALESVIGYFLGAIDF